MLHKAVIYVLSSCRWRNFAGQAFDPISICWHYSGQRWRDDHLPPEPVMHKYQAVKSWRFLSRFIDGLFLGKIWLYIFAAADSRITRSYWHCQEPHRGCDIPSLGPQRIGRSRKMRSCERFSLIVVKLWCCFQCFDTKDVNSREFNFSIRE